MKKQNDAAETTERISESIIQTSRDGQCLLIKKTSHSSLETAPAKTGRRITHGAIKIQGVPLREGEQSSDVQFFLSKSEMGVLINNLKILHDLLD